ncbi:MAG TPA: PadR family transcriptional regulator [Anaerolineaceae bacterium]|nr:PadR family transcriptional regulator [Anaerolineaceae bacterium]HPN51822.1 PadR family transcriptional regulator [Anaerolineaceae bacterium]
MEFVILGLLILQSLTLYEINQTFKQGISLFYSASYGSLQVTLKNLLAKGMIVMEERVENGRNKKVYSITESGRAAFYQWMQDEIPPSKLEVTGLSKVYFLGLLPDVEQKKQVLREIIRKIDLVYGELAQMNDLYSQICVPDAFKEVARYRLKTLDYGLQSHGFARGWFAALLAELEANP